MDKYTEIAKVMHLKSAQVAEVLDFLDSLCEAKSFVVYNSITTQTWSTQKKQFAFFIWGINFGFFTAKELENDY